MQIFLEIEYHTQWGETLYVDGDFSTPMQTKDGTIWSAQIKTTKKSAQYSYLVRRDGYITAREWGKPHQINLPTQIKEVHIIDKWISEPAEVAYYSALFRDSVFRRIEPISLEPKAGTTLIEVDYAQIESNQSIAITGSSEQLGKWDVSKALVMSSSNAPKWSAQLESDNQSEHIEFKFIIINNNGEVVAWEESNNRAITLNNSKQKYYIYGAIRPNFAPSAWRGSGLAIPVFSLRTKESMGVGDFVDLRKMIDWAKMTSQKIIQILPINDTTMSKTWVDSYPYNANSTFALHPQYISLKSVGILEDKELQAKYEKEGEELNKLDQIDYEAVNNLKSQYLNDIFAQDGASLFKTKEFKTFFEDNKSWLEPYALFSLLRDKYNSPNFKEWKEEAKYSSQLLESYTSNKRGKNYKALSYHYFVQYHLHKQLLETRDYAHLNGVVLKGDIPIGISPTSVDAWTVPHLFNMSSQAGAPPDPFSDLGQNWGFPTYNWEAMKSENYDWWRARFSKMAEYFDAYRIDHILGFFRIWDIPQNAVHGILGHFSPALPYTTEEIWNYGFPFHTFHTKPYISEWVINEHFGESASHIKEKFLNKEELDLYSFKPKYDTQKKIQKIVTDLDLAQKLMLLHNQVLFVEDPEQKGKYHPRVRAQGCYAYRALNSWEQSCFDQLHNDFYYRRHNQFWKESAMSKLPMLISATEMLVCGEDLGMIPQSVPEVMEQLQILSLEIERMPKDERLAYGETWLYPHRSVCTTSTHDMSPIRGWWKEDRDVIQKYFNERLWEWGEAPYEAPAYICEKILKNHLNSPAMWTILPWQDWLSINNDLRNPDSDSERINIPANPKHYWRYRMHLTIEQLLESSDINNHIKGLISESNR